MYGISQNFISETIGATNGRHVTDYIMIIGGRDQERFRRFRTCQDGKIIRAIPKMAGVKNIWALRATTDNRLWNSIRKNSRIFFAEHGSPFSHYGLVLGRTTDVSTSVRIWGDTPRIKTHDRLILFSSVHRMDAPFSTMIRYAGLKISTDRTDLYKIQRVIQASTSKRVKRTAEVFLDDDSGAPYRKSGTVTRFDRDRKKVENLKTIYGGRCQICGYALEISSGIIYSEVHHIHPLGSGGDDNMNNMIVVCPTHHKELDYKVIGIGSDGRSIINKNGDKIGKITMKKPHRLVQKNIAYHLKEMKRDGTE